MSPQSQFSQWGLSPDTLISIADMGYKDPTAIQEACIPLLLENSTDLIALAKTGTGKTAAFGIPLIEKIENSKNLQALILCPTRELAAQVAQNMQALGKKKQLKVATILGGESYRKQIDALRAKPQILVSTPGRLIDLMEQGVVHLETVQYLILDEADEMLSFGFQDALEAVWENLIDESVVTWLFSATMSESIKRLTTKYLQDPQEISLVSSTLEPTRVDSYAAVIFEEDKENALSLLLENEPEFYGIIFAQTKRQVSNLEARLRLQGLKVESLHGDKVQAERTRVLQRMKARKTQILVATDVAARGLDIEDLTHVVNFEIPWDVETYTHRIGRTARAGKQGTVWTFVKPKEAHHLRKFEKTLRFQFKPLEIPTVEEVYRKQIQNWIGTLQKIKVNDEKRNSIGMLLQSFAQENNFELSEQTLEWLIKAIAFEKVGGDLKIQQPRSFDLKPSSKGREFSRRDSPRREFSRRNFSDDREQPRHNERPRRFQRDNGNERSERRDSREDRWDRNRFERGERSEKRSFRDAPRGERTRNEKTNDGRTPFRGTKRRDENRDYGEKRGSQDYSQGSRGFSKKDFSSKSGSKKFGRKKR